MKILVVENDDSPGISVGELLTGWGYEVLRCISGNDALKAFKKKPCDLVIMEINLPDIKGEDLISKLKESSADSLIVAMTGKNSREMESRIRKRGILYYMVRPIVAEDLRSLLDFISVKEQTGSKDFFYNI
ncbi:MAG: response regulator [Desulfatiglans sp.]|jgi:DNA-binding response OmpR family regulator|nr:response regulator [Desulfatiglans sp.]